MKASILDLRYNTRDILSALENGEKVTVTERGKERGIIMPLSKRTKKKIEEHEFFGMNPASFESVEDAMNLLRGNRHDI